MIPLFVASFVLALLAGLVWWAWESARKREAVEAEQMQMLGFQQVAAPDAERVARLRALHRPWRKPDELRIARWWERRAPESTLVLADLDPRGNEGSSRVLAVFSPRLHLPAFHLMPRVEGEGRLAALANLAIARLSARAGTPLEFPAVPELGQHYILAADDEAAARRFFDADRLRSVARGEHWMIQAEGDAFVFDHLPFDPARRRPAQRDLPAWTTEALEAYRVLAG